MLNIVQFGEAVL